MKLKEKLALEQTRRNCGYKECTLCLDFWLGKHDSVLVKNAYIAGFKEALYLLSSIQRDHPKLLSKLGIEAIRNIGEEEVPDDA